MFILRLTYESLYRKMRKGKFQLPVDTGGKRAWREADIDKWISELPTSDKSRTGRPRVGSVPR